MTCRRLRCFPSSSRLVGNKLPGCSSYACDMLNMNAQFKSVKFAIAAIYFVCTGLCHAQFHTNTITTPGGVFAFSVDGSPANNPTIELQAGVTNILDIQTDGIHPVVISTSPNTTDWFSGAAPQDVNAQPIALTTPSTGFPTVLYYVCFFHGFFGEIHLSVPGSPSPPPNTILQI